MDLEREQRISRRAYQFWLDEGNPDEWYNWFRAECAITAEDAAAADDLAAQIEAAKASGEADAVIKTKEGREVPIALCGGEMLSVSERQVMRLILNNQSQLATVFDVFARGEEEMPFTGVTDFARAFDIEPTLVSNAQLEEVFTLVNFSEAADEDRDSCDVEEFTELLVRLGVFYGPTDVPMTRTDGVVEGVRALLGHMNNSKAGAKLEPPVFFNVKKANRSPVKASRRK